MSVEQIEQLTEESTSRFVQVGPMSVHYNEVGTGDPILGIHGGGPGASSWSNFKENLVDLARDHRVIMMDMPGWGKTSFVKVETGFLAETANLTKGFLDVLGLSSVDIIGNSMGGQVGLKLAIDYPQRVKHLVMIGSQPVRAITIQSEPLDALRDIVEYYQGSGPSVEKMRTLIKHLVYDSSWVTDDILKERYEASITPNQLERARTPVPREDLYFELEKCRTPTLIIWGQDDKGGALEVGLLMLRRLANARMYIFQKCGHWAHVERREEFDQVVLDFFRN